jgi:predicted MFS family arabinose efflux permease
LTTMMGCLGGMVAGKPLSWIMQASGGWRPALFWTAGFGIILAAACWILIQDAPQSLNWTRPTRLLDSLKAVVRQPQIWLASVIGGLLYLPTSAFAELWAIPFVSAVYGYQDNQASNLTLGLYLGLAIGAPFGAYMADRMKSYVGALNVIAIGGTLCFIIITMAQHFPFNLVIASATLAGILLGGQTLVFAITNANAPQGAEGITSGFTNAIIMVLGLIFQPLMGEFLDISWRALGGQQVDNVPQYTAQMYTYAIVSLPLCLGISWVLLRRLRETYTQHV